ncbi:DNA adenine methylase [Deinococcus marmoris]|uniref:site-specific DNA-methyltransferase (adenine-specific) n=1 Tax=Deinococcus marmoris TaxID=249408 RepID=A0A1U7P4S9_9DEIO|nr:DNA adenine methylase [Deinococcus marmoris]OLV20160.1 Methyltransferase [Deinococcus marmoris]
MTAAPVLRWPGSKWRIAEWVIGHLPPHKVYCEPFFGSGGVFFLKPEAATEIINDLDGNVVAVFRVLRTQPQALAEQVSLTPWALDEYEACCAALLAPDELPDLERARCMITITWQQYGKRAMQRKTGWRFRGVDQQTPLTAWRNLPERIAFAADRLMNAQISNLDALALIQRVNNSETLLYIDPPYLGETHKAGRLYDHELKTPAEHQALIDAVLGHVGPVVMSGYPSAQYSEQLAGWHLVSTTARAQSNGHRQECLWINPVGWRRLRGTHGSLDWLGQDGGLNDV